MEKEHGGEATHPPWFDYKRHKRQLQELQVAFKYHLKTWIAQGCEGKWVGLAYDQCDEPQFGKSEEDVRKKFSESYASCVLVKKVESNPTPFSV